MYNFYLRISSFVLIIFAFNVSGNLYVNFVFICQTVREISKVHCVLCRGRKERRYLFSKLTMVVFMPHLGRHWNYIYFPLLFFIHIMYEYIHIVNYVLQYILYFQTYNWSYELEDLFCWYVLISMEFCGASYLSHYISYYFRISY